MPACEHGVGLRPEHYPDVVAPLLRGERVAQRGLAWLEIISENFLEPGGNPWRVLRTVRDHFPIRMHGVSLSLGSVDALNDTYLERLAALVHEVEPLLVSDHLCWGSFQGRYAHDLLPLPFTEEALAHVATRVLQVQERLKRPLAIENVSSYLAFSHSALSEWEFLAALVQRTDCRLLLDVNNVYVSAHNHGWDAYAFIAGVPRGAVAQAHLAGHQAEGALLLDTHDTPVCDEVWALYRFMLEQHGPVPTCIEWDDALPSFSRLLDESARAATISEEVLGA